MYCVFYSNNDNTFLTDELRLNWISIFFRKIKGIKIYNYEKMIDFKHIGFTIMFTFIYFLIFRLDNFSQSNIF